ncbi:MAG: hypothetical protein AB1454_09705 [Candidatus Auribacterota bacterium]
MHIVIVADQGIPLHGQFAHPKSLRAWSLGAFLKGKGHVVSYLVPCSSSHTRLTSIDDPVYFYAAHDLNSLIKTLKPDCLLACDWRLAEKIQTRSIPMIIDLDGNSANDSCPCDISSQINKINALRKGDYFLCATQQQKYFYMGWLMHAGYTSADQLIAVVSPPVPSLTENRAKNDDLTFVSFWDSGYKDFNRYVKSLLVPFEQAGYGKLSFLCGSSSLNDTLQNTVFLDDKFLIESSYFSLTEIFRWNELTEMVSSSHASICIDEGNTLDNMTIPQFALLSLSMGVPVICRQGTVLAELVQRYEAGWSINVDNCLNLRKHISALLSSNRDFEAVEHGALELYTALTRNSKGLQDLAEFCSHPHKYAGKTDGIVSHFLDHSHTILNINNPLLNDIYIDEILLFVSNEWDHLSQCLEAIDILFPLSTITLLCPADKLCDDVELTPNCNLIIYEHDEFAPEAVKEILIDNESCRFDLGIALFNNQFGEGNETLKSALLSSGAKYKVGFTESQNFIILEDSIEKCISDILADVPEMPGTRNTTP